MNLAQLKRRLKSIKSIVEITKAMELISAIKLNQIQSNVNGQKEFSEDLRVVLASLVNNDSIRNNNHWSLNPSDKAQDKELVVVFGAERGLCGSLNTHLVREIINYKKTSNITLITIGHKISTMLSRQDSEVIAAFPGFGWKEFSKILTLSSMIFSGYEKGDWNKVSIAYPAFISTISQKPVIKTFLPMSLWQETESQEAVDHTDFKLEGTPEQLVGTVLPFLLELELWHINLEANASEQAARFMSMSQAKTNSEDLKQDLTLTLNDLRQSQITNSLIETLSVQDA